MNKQELIKRMAEHAELSQKDSEKALKAFEEVITTALVNGEKVQLVGFGTFEVGERQPRVGRNPKTNEEIQIPGCKVPKLKFGKTIKEVVNQ